MKKTLIALAAVAAVGAASAQVTLYGKVDMGVIGINNGAGISSTSVNSGNFNGSRFGLKGTDDLGAGMSMSFQMEAGVNADTGASGQGGLLFGRQAYISLNTAGGSLSAGRQYTPGDSALCSVDLSGCAGAGGGAMAALFSVSGNGGDNWGNARQNNSVAYTLPGNLGGLVGQVMLAPDENGTAAPANDYKGAWLGYAAGAFSVHGAWESSTAVAAMTQTNTFLGATFDAKVAKLSLSTNIGTTAAQTDASAYAAQVAMPLGPINAIFAIATQKTTAKAAATSASTNAWSIQGGYDLSKKSRVYGGYQAAAATAAAVGSTAVNSSVWTVGMQTDF